jgi:hypothetical protein
VTQLTLPGPDVAPEVEAGDRIRVVRNDPYSTSGGSSSAQTEELGLESYSFADFERRSPLYLLAGPVRRCW